MSLSPLFRSKGRTQKYVTKELGKELNQYKSMDGSYVDADPRKDVVQLPNGSSGKVTTHVGYSHFVQRKESPNGSVDFFDFQVGRIGASSGVHVGRTRSGGIQGYRLTVSENYRGNATHDVVRLTSSEAEGLFRRYNSAAPR